MKALAGVMVFSFATTVMAQRVTPPAIPNTAPAQPQPGIATGATGGIGTPATGLTPGVTTTVPGRATATPPPVLMTPDQLTPQYPDPLLIMPDLFPYVDVSPQPPVVGRGRPGGLGVTITGGHTNPPPITPPATNATPPPTNAPPPPTNAPPVPTNQPPQGDYNR